VNDDADTAPRGVGVVVVAAGSGARLAATAPKAFVPLAGRPILGHALDTVVRLQGLRSLEEGFVPEVFDPSLLDGKFLVSNRDAIAALRDLVFREGIFAGPSCGAVLVAAARVARQMGTGTIVALLPDGGWKYLSADFWDAGDVDAAMEKTVWW